MTGGVAAPKPRCVQKTGVGGGGGETGRPTDRQRRRRQHDRGSGSTKASLCAEDRSGGGDRQTNRQTETTETT